MDLKWRVILTPVIVRQKLWSKTENLTLIRKREVFEDLLRNLVEPF